MNEFVPLLAGFGLRAAVCGPIYTKLLEEYSNDSQSSLPFIDKQWMTVTCLILIVL